MAFLTKPFACQEMVELISDYLEGALSRSERRRFEAHLRGCPHCSEYLAEMRLTIAATGRLRPENLTPAMREAFGEIFKRWRAEGGGT
jgi:anti-sigma factor RsiW